MKKQEKTLWFDPNRDTTVQVLGHIDDNTHIMVHCQIFDPEFAGQWGCGHGMTYNVRFSEFMKNFQKAEEIY